MTIRRNQTGQVLISTALAMVVLLGFAGLAVDMGILRYQRRVQQNAADAAAIAGATDLPSNYQIGAVNAAAANGFTDNTGGLCPPPTNLAVGSVNVCVTLPISGPHVGQSGYVEAYVSAGQPTFFMRILGVNSKTITARSVASNNSTGTKGAPYGCMYAIGTPGNPVQGMNVQGGATLSAPSCGIVDNGDYTSAGVITASSLGVSGANNGGGGTGTCTDGAATCPSFNSPAAADPFAGPLAGYTPPCSPCGGGTDISITGGGNFSGVGVGYANGTYTVIPGTYDAITIATTGGENVVFSSGSYVINGAGGLSVTGNANISGTGVMFYFTGPATINVTGTPTLNLNAPATGQYAGMLMWQDAADTANPSLSANNGSQLNGILYFPSDQLTFAANPNLNVGAVVAGSVSVAGGANVTINGGAINGGPGVPGGLPTPFTAPSAVLVE
ncbi:MAG TPA: pilus assembly protein TadG-related protein [Verrucomicrobiae bacterium]|nr:pilus assembly protein TadG-related protein [Verrucomicrobiae bacterium]